MLRPYMSGVRGEANGYVEVLFLPGGVNPAPTKPGLTGAAGLRGGGQVRAGRGRPGGDVKSPPQERKAGTAVLCLY